MTKLMLVVLCAMITALHSFSQSENELSDEEILELYAKLRVADVSDGLDMVGLRDLCILDQKIVPLWRDIDSLKHIFRGIALTARYVPTNRVIKNPMNEQEFKEWESKWYTEISSEPFVEFIKPGTAIILDVQGDGDCGSVGSYNGLAWVSKGAVGIVSNGGIRDTDEIIKEKIPVYLDMDNRGRGIRPGRNEIESVNQPVSIGGVLIRAGDVVVADGDGVVVVPREYALEVARFAGVILDSDKTGRRKLYEELNMPLDQTVEP